MYKKYRMNENSRLGIFAEIGTSSRVYRGNGETLWSSEKGWAKEWVAQHLRKKGEGEWRLNAAPDEQEEIERLIAGDTSGWKSLGALPETFAEAIAILRTFSAAETPNNTGTIGSGPELAAIKIVRSAWAGQHFFMISGGGKMARFYSARNAPSFAFEGRHARFAPTRPT